MGQQARAPPLTMELFPRIRRRGAGYLLFPVISHLTREFPALYNRCCIAHTYLLPDYYLHDLHLYIDFQQSYGIWR